MALSSSRRSMLTKHVLPALAVITCLSTAAYADLSDTYLRAFATAREAEAICPNTVANYDRLGEMKEAAAIRTDDEKEEARKALMRIAQKARSDSSSGSARWCNTALKEYGPEGIGVISVR
jgi:hypothetical protein